MKRIKIPHAFCNSKGEDDKEPIFKSLGCTVTGHSQGLLVNNYFVVSLASNRWRAIDSAKWYPYKNIKDLVDRYIKTSNDPIRKAKVTKAIIYRYGWAKIAFRTYIKDGVIVKRELDQYGYPNLFAVEVGGELYGVYTVGQLMMHYEHYTKKPLEFPDYEYVRTYIEKHGNVN